MASVLSTHVSILVGERAKRSDVYSTQVAVLVGERAARSDVYSTQVALLVGEYYTTTTTTVTTTTVTIVPVRVTQEVIEVYEVIPSYGRTTQEVIEVFDRTPSHGRTTQVLVEVFDAFTTTTSTSTTSTSTTTTSTVTTTTTVSGSICYGHDTSVEEVNIEDFTGKWEGTASISGSGDTEKVGFAPNQYKQLIDPWYYGAGQAVILLNKYRSGSNVTICYKTAPTLAGIAAASWQNYTGKFTSQGFIDVRLTKGVSCGFNTTTTTTTTTSSTASTTSTTTVTTTTIDGNYFDSDTDVVALYRFESGALTTDSISTNDLTDNASCAANTTNYKEGSSSVDIDYTGYDFMKLAEVDQSSDFPMKTGDTTKVVSMCGWYRPTSYTGWRYIFGKTSYYYSGRQGVGIGASTGNLYVHWGANSWGYDYSIGKSMTLDQWYHIAIRADGVNKQVDVRVWDDTAQSLHTYSVSPAFEMDVGSQEFRIGAFNDVDNNYISTAQEDEVVVWKRLVNNDEFDKVRQGIYRGPFTTTTTT